MKVREDVLYCTSLHAYDEWENGNDFVGIVKLGELCIGRKGDG